MISSEQGGDEKETRRGKMRGGEWERKGRGREKGMGGPSKKESER